MPSTTKPLLRCAAASGFLLLMAPGLVRLGAAQQQPVNSPVGFRESINLGTVRVTVTGRDGDSVPGLRAEDFAISVDDEDRDIMVLINEADDPLDVVVMLDTSGSIERDVPDIRPLLREFLSALQGNDCVLMLPFNEDVGPGYWDLDVPSFVDSFELGGSTKLYDAIHSGLNALSPAADDVVSWRGPQGCGRTFDAGIRKRRVAVLITDGQDTDSYATAGSSLVTAYERHTPMIILGVGLVARSFPAPVGSRGRSSDPWRRAREISAQMIRLAAVSGGRYIRARGDHAEHFATILQTIRSSYVLGYRLENPPPHGAIEWRKVDVDVHRPDTEVNAPEGIWVSASSPEAAANMMQVGVTAFDNGRFREALEYFNFAVRDHWESARAHYLRAMTASRLQNWPVAQESSQWAMFLDPTDRAHQTLRRQVETQDPNTPLPRLNTGPRVALWADASSHDTLPDQQSAQRVVRLVAAHAATFADIRLIRRPVNDGIAYGLVVLIDDIDDDGTVRVELTLVDQDSDRMHRERFELTRAELAPLPEDGPPTTAPAAAEAVDEALRRLRDSFGR